MTISSLPTPPNRRLSPEVFSDEADAFLAALPAFGTEANALATELNAAKVAAELAETNSAASAADAAVQVGLAGDQVALAAAEANAAAASAASALNAPGTNAFATDSLTIGLGTKALTIQTDKAYAVGQFVIAASVGNPGNYMIGQITAYNAGTGSLVLNVTSTGGNGTYADWNVALTAPADASTVAGGMEATATATSFALSTTAKRLQVITFTAENQSVTLPGATALPLGGELYVIENAGAYPFAVRDSVGTLKTVIQPGQIGAAYLKDNTTSAGVWAFGSMRGGELGRVLNNTATVFTPGTNPTSVRFALLTPTTGVMLWDSSSTVYRCVVTIDGTSVTFGAVTSSVLTGLSQARLIRLSDTQAICSSGNSVFALTVDGETITVGAIATQASITAGALGGIERLTDTAALLYYTRSSTSYATCCLVVTVTGNVCTFGAAWTSTATGYGPISCRAVVMSPTLAFVTYSDTTSTRMYVTAVSISGTTIATVTSIQVTSSATDAAVETYGFIKLRETSALLLVGLFDSGLAANSRNFRTYIVRYESSILSCDKPQFLSIGMDGDDVGTFGFDAGEGVMLCMAYETPPYKQPSSSLLQLSCNGSHVVQLPYVPALDYSTLSKDLSFLNKKGVCVGKANDTNGIAVSIIEVA